MSQVRNLWTFIREDILGTDNRYIAFAWTAAVAAVLGLGIYLTSESVSFLGVADSRELQVNFEYPVEIKRIHVLPGQAVKQGDLLIELNASALNSRMRELQMQLGTLEAELKVRQNLNRILKNQAQVDSVDPLSVQINDLKEELALVENQKKNLYIFANVSGIIGTVNYKKGEKVPAFTALLTISSESPTYVQGFIHENLHTHLEVGRKVRVFQANARGPMIEGIVASVGSRIVQFPPRLAHNPALAIWGREVTVEIPENNRLLLGEKVIIKPRFQLFGPAGIGFTSAIASQQEKEGFGRALKLGPQSIHFPQNMATRLSFEPSGLAYLPELKKFMVVSDDTDTDKTPYVFLMDRDGQVDDQPLRVPGIAALDDLESISLDGNMIYLMTSLSEASHQSQKDFPNARGVLVRSQFSGLRFDATESVSLRPLLIKALGVSQDPVLRKVAGQLESTGLEVEGHWVANNNLYLGLKTPMTSPSSALILVLQDVNALFATQKLPTANVRIHMQIRFTDELHSGHQISDLTVVNGELYATTKIHKKLQGALWKIPTNTQDVVSAELIQRFEGHNPEGVALDPESDSLFVTFDQGSAKASFERVPLTKTKSPRP